MTCVYLLFGRVFKIIHSACCFTFDSLHKHCFVLWLIAISRSHNEGGNWHSTEMPLAQGDEFELLSSSSSQERRWKVDSRRNDNGRCCKRKRDCTGPGGDLDSSTLDIGIPLAWKSLYRNRWPQRSRQSPSPEYDDSDCDKGEDNVDADWQQLYWEAHLQE